MHNNLKKELKVVKDVAKKIGRMQRSFFLDKKHVIRKSSKELVSKVDIESQKIAEDILREKFPLYEIFTEEKKAQAEYPKDTPFWVIDPLDGTHNYIAGLPFYGIAIALAESNDFYLGAIYMPVFDSLFFAVKQQGAYCNDKPISVSKNNNLSKGMVAYDNQFYLSPNSFPIYKKLVEKSFTTRITGSAAYDICLVASGKIDARIWNSTKICDIAAGIPLVTEAGGRVTDFKGQPVSLFCSEVVVSNGSVHEEIIAMLNN